MAFLPDIRDKAIFDLCHIGIIARQLLEQRAFLQHCTHQQSREEEQDQQEAVPGAQQQRCPEKQEETTSIQRVTHVIRESGYLLIQRRKNATRHTESKRETASIRQLRGCLVDTFTK